MPGWRRRYRLGLYILIAAAFGARIATLDMQSMWRDEIDALRFATAAWSDLLVTFRTPGWNGPLYFAVLRGWIALAGQTSFALRYFSLLPGVLAVALLYCLARRLALGLPGPGLLSAFPLLTALLPAAERKRRSSRAASDHQRRPADPNLIGVGAALCGAFSPYFIWYSQETKMYSMVLVLTMLALYALRRALDGRAAWWVVMVAAASLSVYMHILAALLIPVAFLMMLVWTPRSWRKWAEGLVAFACLTLPYLPLLAWQFPMIFSRAETGYPFYPLNEMIYTMLYGFATGMVGHPFGWILVLPLVILVVTGVLSGPVHWRARSALVIWMGLPILAMYVVSLLHGPIFTDRYLIWIGPAVYILAVWGAWALARPAPLLALAVVLPLLIAFGRGEQAQTAGAIKSDFRAAAHFVEQRAAPDDLLVFQIPHIRYTFDYYYAPAFEGVDGLYTNYGLTETEVDAQMRALVGRHRVVWLVASEMPMWDKPLQVLGWLDQHTRRTDEAHFALVDVYRYQLDP